MSGLPDLDRHALVMADLAWVETIGSGADKTEAAIRAYLWAVEVSQRTGWYPSLDEWRAAAHRATAAAAQPEPRENAGEGEGA